MDSAKSFAASQCLLVLLLLAFLLSFFSFCFRADSWQEVWEATLLNFVLIGPLWAGIVFRGLRRRHVGIGGSIGAAFVTYLLVATCHSAWTAFILKIRLAAAKSLRPAGEKPIVP